MSNEKTYRPKANLKNVGVTVTLANGKQLDVDSWPYTTSDPDEQRALAAMDLVTDRPQSSKESSKGEDK